MPPSDIDWGWDDAPAPMFDDDLPPVPPDLKVPKAFGGLVSLLMSERSGQGFAVAHALLHRLQLDKALLSRRADPDVARAQSIAKEIRRDLHKMHAFVRFREVGDQTERRRFMAWFEPTHRIEEAVADFFVNRFGDMDWAIVTPEVTTVFEHRRLAQTAVAASRPDNGDPLEALWTTYYANIFNPARLKVDAMTAEMPKKYWKNLPEARLIPDLIAGARSQVRAMQDRDTRPARALAPQREKPANTDQSLADLKRAALGCTACPLHCDATQTVFGEGADDAPLMIVGEQPGDREDLAGRPFVGPAGQLFDEVAGRVGLDRTACYVTNAVKHFKFVQRGKRRLHQRPGVTEVRACAPWLHQEAERLAPRLVLALGATALLSLTGSGADLMQRRGRVERTTFGTPLFVTVHPASVLRQPDLKLRAERLAEFEQDLSRVVDLLKT
ncbi:MAG: UdgX family uracil-DNA binding protein [Jannaschia sp.]